MICPFCGKPTFFGLGGEQVPGSPIGDPVEHLPPDVQALYREAQWAAASGAFTASVLTCRKLLMHIAVEKGAEPRTSFLEYVTYLDEKRYVPPDGKAWVDYIRTRSNEANHKIVLMKKEDAKALIEFTNVLLRVIYEMPKRAPAAPRSRPRRSSPRPIAPSGAVAFTTMDPMSQTGRCLCGASVWYVRARDAGERGHFHCRRCGQRYGSNEEEWTPGAPPRYLT